MTHKLQIAIVGAGIGGLSAALALRARGLNATVFERALSPREAGAGISIQPNAARLLKRIGLHDRLENIGTRTVGLSLRRAASPFRRRLRLPIIRTTRFIAWNCWRCSMTRRPKVPFALVIIVSA